MRHVAIAVCLALGSAAAPPAAISLSQAAPGPAFEVVSIKLSPQPHLQLPRGAAWTFPEVASGRWRAPNISLAQLVAHAYGLHCCGFAVVAGSPDLGKWMDSTGFAIVATTATETVSDAQLRAMLRQMLVTRFQLKTHVISKAVPVYTIEVAAGGSKLRPAGPCDPSGDAADKPGAVQRCGLGGRAGGKPGDRIGAFRSITMAELAEWWETSFFVLDHHPIVDRTDLQGPFDFDLRVHIPSAVGTPDGLYQFASEAVRGLEAQDGLQLDIFHTTRLPIPVRVIDHAVIPAN